jgi:hypothetical protein
MHRRDSQPVEDDMDRRNAPAEAWGQAVGFWFRLWQAQIDQSLKFWCLWAQTLPHPTASELAAEAEAMRDITSSPAPRKTASRSGSAPRNASRKSDAATVH